jgi:hypothetical protein
MKANAKPQASVTFFKVAGQDLNLIGQNMNDRWQRK